MDPYEDNISDSDELIELSSSSSDDEEVSDHLVELSDNNNENKIINKESNFNDDILSILATETDDTILKGKRKTIPSEQQTELKLLKKRKHEKHVHRLLQNQQNMNRNDV